MIPHVKTEGVMYLFKAFYLFKNNRVFCNVHPFHAYPDHKRHFCRETVRVLTLGQSTEVSYCARTKSSSDWRKLPRRLSRCGCFYLPARRSPSGRSTELRSMTDPGNDSSFRSMWKTLERHDRSPISNGYPVVPVKRCMPARVLTTRCG